MAPRSPGAFVTVRLSGVGMHIAAVAGCCVLVAGSGIVLAERSGTAGILSTFMSSGPVLAFSVALVLLFCAAAALSWTAFREHEAWELERRKVVEAHQSGFDSASDAIVVLDVDGGIETLNKAAEKMFGRTRAELQGLDATALFDLASSEGSITKRLETTADDLNVGIHRELAGKRSGAETFPIEVTFRELLQPGSRQIVGFVRDISERKRVEQLKNEFVSTVNHELRTPLTSIAGSLGLLAGGAAGELPAAAARLIGIAHANCQRLIRLINDVLDVEKIESGAMRFDLAALRLAEAAQRAVESLQGYADELGVAIEVEAGDAAVDVHADADRLLQVMTNLISNALKFSVTGGRIVVSTERVGRIARFSVKDDGPGIPDKFRSRIFTKFAQADSSDTRQKSGTGLGLVIAKEIVERHGGRLWFESEPGKGAVFFVDLPVFGDTRTEIAPAATKVVLICEDDLDLASVLREILERDGHAVEHVATKRDALRVLTAAPSRFAAVLLDLVLPDGDGVELIRELRSSAATREIPVIVASVDAERRKKELGSHALNVVDWMHKPVDVVRLKSAVRGATASVARAKPVILHVEDDPDLLQLAASVLGDRCRMISAESLGAARTALRQNRPDLVILDLGLKDGSGLELLAELRHEDGRLIPVVVFSAADADRLVLKEVKAVLTKSRTSLPQLADVVCKLLADPPTENIRKEAAAR